MLPVHFTNHKQIDSKNNLKHKQMEDYQTSTVDGARGFAQANDDDYDNFEGGNVDYQESEEEDDDCNCSDPGCPCGGTKRGGV